MSNVLEKKKLLLVDDQAHVRDLLRELFTDFRVFEARNGQEALDLLARTTPDLILLDIDMPVMSGVETFRRMKERESSRSIPVIFLTASNSKEIVEECILQGAMSYILKPFDPSDVRKRVSKVMEKLNEGS
ncbi:response regulator [Candidatus Hydrogenedentota bacterium]